MLVFVDQKYQTFFRLSQLYFPNVKSLLCTVNGLEMTAPTTEAKRMNVLTKDSILWNGFFEIRLVFIVFMFICVYS